MAVRLSPRTRALSLARLLRRVPAPLLNAVVALLGGVYIGGQRWLIPFWRWANITHLQTTPLGLDAKQWLSAVREQPPAQAPRPRRFLRAPALRDMNSVW
jgi:hypothetical protein